jgi:hypothetical protein
MAGRIFTVSAGGITLANQAVTLVFINPAAAPNFGIRIKRCWANQSANATSAQQRVQLVTQVTAFPTLTSATPRPHKKQDPNVSVITGGTAGAAGTAGTNASAEGAGAKTILYEDAFNVLTGFLWQATPDEQIELPAGLASGFGLHLPVAAATLTNWAFGVTFEEY